MLLAGWEQLSLPRQGVSLAEMADRDVLVLFDVDGTLTPSRLVIKPDMKEFLLDLKKKVVIGKQCWGAGELLPAW